MTRLEVSHVNALTPQTGPQPTACGDAAAMSISGRRTTKGN